MNNPKADLEAMARETCESLDPDYGGHECGKDVCSWCPKLLAFAERVRRETVERATFEVGRKIGLAVMIHANGKSYQDGLNYGMKYAISVIRAAFAKDGRRS